MRAFSKVLGIPSRQVRHSLVNAIYAPRVSLVSFRQFQSFAPLCQEAEAFAEEQYRPRRYDATGSEIARSNDRYGQRGTTYRNGQQSKFRRSDDVRSVPRVQQAKFDVTSFINEEGQREELQDDITKLPAYDYDRPEQVHVNETETEIKQQEGSEYQPVRWLEYKGKIDDGFLNSLKSVFRFSHLTEVQNRILSLMPIQKDILVRSKTGTGKTIGFLVPAIQRHIDYMRENKLNQKTHPKTHSGVLIVSPTRELAMQIAQEARRLVFAVEPNGMKVQVLVGGDNKRSQIRRMDRERNDIIVATPGRLLDFLTSEPGVREMLLNIKTLILDEMDNLLDMGFKRDIERLLWELKSTDQDRLNMMFSATISKEVTEVARKAVHHDVQFINLVNPNDLDVHQTVKQTYIVREMGEHLKIILSLIISEQLKRPDGKIIVFFNTTKQVQMYTVLFRFLRRLYYNPHFQQFEIHSKKSQDTRAKVTQAFRTANVGSVLFTSDVSARGVDYPGVTKVIQVGAPVSRDQYIHRIGRTGRAGKSGDGTLILAPFEKAFLDHLDDIPIEDHDLPESELEVGAKEKRVFDLALKVLPPGMILEAFGSMLGYYLPKAGDWGYSQEKAMREMENWGLAMGAPSVPKVRDDVLRKIVGQGRMHELQGHRVQSKNYSGNRLPAVFVRGGDEEHFERDHFKPTRDWEGGGSGGRRGGFESGGRPPRGGFESGGRPPRGPVRNAGGNKSKPSWDRRGRN